MQVVSRKPNTAAWCSFLDLLRLRTANRFGSARSCNINIYAHTGHETESDDREWYVPRICDYIKMTHNFHADGRALKSVSAGSTPAQLSCVCVSTI